MPSAPERTCIGCRRRDTKAALLRIVAAAGRIETDPAARKPGRGAYVHPVADCVSAALAPAGLARALRTALPEAEAARLRAEMERIVHE